VPQKYTFKPEDARTFKKDGSWFVDSSGRYILFRGVNFGSRSKMPPYLPVYPLGLHVLRRDILEHELEVVKGEMAELKRLGFNVVRLVIQWKGVAPHSHATKNDEYLEAVRIIVDELFKLGIYSLIDFHQDLASEKYGGDGFPDWAIRFPPSPPAHVRSVMHWSVRYGRIPLPSIPFVIPLLNTRVRHTLRSFWKNKTRNGGRQIAVQDKLVESISATADAFRHLKGVLGYEPFNEPHPSSLPKEEFEREHLGSFYRRVIDRIAAVDAESPVFIEPRVDWTVFTPPSRIETFLPGTFEGKKTVFSFHYYDSRTQLLALFGLPDRMYGKGKRWGRVFTKILQAAQERDLIPFLTEYGCDYFGECAWQAPARVRGRRYDTQSRAYMDVSLQKIEEHLLNSTLWVFDLYSTLDHFDNWNMEDSSLMDWNRQIRDTDIIARPYPMRSSAKPTVLFFDSKTKHGAAMFEGKPVKEPTVVYVPDAYQYPGGFEVRHTSGELSWDLPNHLLYWYPDAKETKHQLIVCPRDGFDPRELPDAPKHLLPKTTHLFRAPGPKSRPISGRGKGQVRPRKPKRA
jgi:endoglycosylceramidase